MKKAQRSYLSYSSNIYKTITLFLKTTSVERGMAPSKIRGIASRHLVSGTFSNLVHFDSSGCPKSWPEMREGSPACVFTCKGVGRWQS